MAKILVIDDDPQLAVLLKDLLEGRGHEVQCANNGRAGWQLAQDFRPDLAIIDIVMPEMDGFEVMMRFRTNLRLKIIAVSGGGTRWKQTESFLDIATTLGAHRSLPKPINLDELLRAVEDLLNEAPGDAGPKSE